MIWVRCLYREQTACLYSATATVVLEDDNSKKLFISDFDPSLSVDFYTFGTQARVLTSRTLAEKVVLAMDLTEDPYFNPYVQSVEGDIPVTDDKVIFSETAIAALGAISISNERETYVYDITASTPYPEKSANLATQWAEAYVQDQRDVKIEETQKATKWLGEKLAEMKVALEASEKDLSGFNANTDLINPQALEGLNQQLKSTRDRYKNERDVVDALAARLVSVRQALEKQDFETVSELMPDQILSRLLANLDPSVSGTLVALDSRADLLMRNIQTMRVQSEQKLATLAQAVEALAERVVSQSNDLIALEQLAREVDANRVIYDFFLNKIREVSIQSGTLRADSRVLSTALVPSSPVSPRKQRVIALGLLLGACIGVGIVLMREFLNNTFRTPEELEAATGYLVMGRFPRIHGQDRRERLEYVTENQMSRAAEALRSLRTSLLLSNMDRTPEVVMITSAMAGEGKTTVSLALAGSLANLEKKVLLVECDVRRRTFAEFFGQKRDIGLISVLSGQAELADCLYQDETLGYDVLFSDDHPINAVDVFSSHRFKKFLDDMREKYDVVILDTPPVLIVSDACVVAPLTDATLFVAQWNKTSVKNVRDGLRALEDIGVKAVGLVLSQISLDGMRAYRPKSDPLFDREAQKYYHEG